MENTPKYVKPSDFYNYTGKELKSQLLLGDNESNMDNIFLCRVEDALMARVDAISFRNFFWDRLSKFQLECLQKAIIVQADYMIRYGNIFSDTGYDSERGFIADLSKIQDAAICPEAKDKLIQCGILNHVMKNKRRYTQRNMF